jgi:hypothetical protein
VSRHPSRMPSKATAAAGVDASVATGLGVDEPPAHAPTAATTPAAAQARTARPDLRARLMRYHP